MRNLSTGALASSQTGYMNKLKPFFWSFINTGGSQILAFVGSMAIARIAGPEVFGVFAIASAIVLIGNIFAEAGFSSTIIYDDLFCSEKASTILWLSVFISILIFLLLFLFAKPLAVHFGAPRLQSILPFMAFTCIATSLGNAHAALITRNLQFKKKAILSLGSNIPAVIVGVTVAFSGFPLAGLTMNFVLTPFLMTIFMWLLAPWPVKFICRPQLLIGNIAYASNIAFSSFLDQIGKSSVTFFIGQRFDIVTVGYFSRSEAIKNVASQTIDKVIQRVSFPVLSRARNSREDFISSHLSISQALILILIPLCWYIQKFSNDIVALLFGIGWSESASILKIAILGGFCIPLTSLNLTLLKSCGRAIFIMFNKGFGVLLIIGIFVYSPDTDIFSILKMIVGVFVTQLITSILSLVWVPEFDFIDYFKMLATAVLVAGIATTFYELWANFDINFSLANLTLHGVALFVSMALIVFIARKIIFPGRTVA